MEHWRDLIPWEHSVWHWREDEEEYEYEISATEKDLLNDYPGIRALLNKYRRVKIGINNELKRRKEKPRVLGVVYDSKGKRWHYYVSCPYSKRQQGIIYRVVSRHCSKLRP